MKIKIKKIKYSNNRWSSIASLKVDENLLLSFSTGVANYYIPEGIYVPVSFKHIKEIWEYYHIEELNDLINNNEKFDRYLITHYK